MQSTTPENRSHLPRLAPAVVAALMLGGADALAADPAGSDAATGFSRPAQQIEPELGDSGTRLKEQSVPGLDEQAVPKLEEQPAPQVQEQSVPDPKKQVAPGLDERAAPRLEEPARPALDERAVPDLEQRPAPGLDERAAPRLREAVPEGREREAKSGDAPASQPAIEPAGIGGDTGGSGTGGFSAPASATEDAAGTTPEISDEARAGLDGAGWAGDLEIVELGTEGPVGSDMRVAGSPTPAIIDHPYRVRLLVRNEGERATRAVPMYEGGEGLRRAGGADMTIPPDGVNLPAGEITEIPVTLDLDGLSPSERERVVRDERFTTTLFLADPHTTGSSLNSRLIRDADPGNHQREVSLPVVVFYDVALEIDRIVVEYNCSAHDTRPEWELFTMLGSRAGSSGVKTVDAQPLLRDAYESQTYAPGTRLELARVQSHHSIRLEFHLLPTEIRDGRLTEVASASVEWNPFEWKGGLSTTVTLSPRTGPSAWSWDEGCRTKLDKSWDQYDEDDPTRPQPVDTERRSRPMEITVRLTAAIP